MRCEGREAADLQIGALVVVDAHELVPRLRRQIRHQRRLAARRWALQNSAPQI